MYTFIFGILWRNIMIKIVFGWVIALFVFNYLFRHSKIERIGYVIAVTLLALVYFVIPV